MPYLIALIFSVFSLPSFATNAPAYCGRDNACHKGYIWGLSSGIYYARGFGRTCKEAKDYSRDNFIRTFGHKQCGLFSGPYSNGCYPGTQGMLISWHICDPDSGSQPSPRRGTRCVSIQGRLVCQ